MRMQTCTVNPRPSQDTTSLAGSTRHSSKPRRRQLVEVDGQGCRGRGRVTFGSEGKCQLSMVYRPQS